MTINLNIENKTEERLVPDRMRPERTHTKKKKKKKKKHKKNNTNWQT